MNKELMEALNILEKEKEISKETLFEAIENSLMFACKNHFGKADNVKVEINRETCDFCVYAEKSVVETADDVMDDMLEIALEDAKKIAKKSKVGDIVKVEIIFIIVSSFTCITNTGSCNSIFHINSYIYYLFCSSTALLKASLYASSS